MTHRQGWLHEYMIAQGPVMSKLAGSHAWDLMFCGCRLEIPNNCIFEFVFCKGTIKQARGLGFLVPMEPCHPQPLCSLRQILISCSPFSWCLRLPLAFLPCLAFFPCPQPPMNALPSVVWVQVLRGSGLVHVLLSISGWGMWLLSLP